VITAKGSLRIVEEPYVFAARAHGESKLNTQVALDFLGLLAAKFTGGVVTPRFLSFALVGMLVLASISWCSAPRSPASDCHFRKLRPPRRLWP